MTITPTPRTAVLAGIWSSLGMIPFELWMRAHGPDTGGTMLFVWLTAAIIFLAIPAKLLVIGKGRSFGKDWLNDPAERARYLAIIRRMAIWIVSATVVGLLWSALFGGRGA